jgi:osmoprotectant transport system permease protein
LIGAVIVLGILLISTGHWVRRGRARAGLRPAFDAEFMTRPDGYLGLQEHYGLAFAVHPKQMDPGLMYRALADGAVDVIDGFATDGRIPAYGLLVLEDDKDFFPPYHAAPLVRSETLKKHAELEELLKALTGRISDKTMRDLNYQADEKGRKATDIAREFLVSEGLIRENAQPGDGSAGTITVGSKHFTEQEILGEILAILVECKTDIRATRKLNLGGTMICFNALKAGDLDLYAEYTGTGLVNILNRDVIADPKLAYETVRKEFKEKYGLVWLLPFGFNNTYTLTMRAEHARHLGISTISDLAAYIKKQRGR